MKTITIIAAAASGLLATAAFAAPAATRTAAADATAAEVAPANAADERVCVQQTPTGSRVPRKLCQTRAQWTAQGINVDSLSR